MAHSGSSSRRSRTSPLAVLLLVTVAGVATTTAACGGGAKPSTSPAASASASGSAGKNLALSPPPSGLPPMAPMPPPGVAGSKKAKKKTDGALYACGAGVKPIAKDPADLVKRTGEGCAAASKMKATGALIRGTQADKDAHQDHKLRVEANKCYRVYFASDEGTKDAVVVMRDSAGDVVAESAGAALPEDGAVCFTSADEITLSIGVGSGKGAYAAQLWTD